MYIKRPKQVSARPSISRAPLLLKPDGDAFARMSPAPGTLSRRINPAASLLLTRAAPLNASRLTLRQRDCIAAQLGMVLGNQYLQRLIIQMNDGDDSKPATGRYKKVYQNLFIDKPGTGTGTRKPWSSGKKSEIIKQARKNLKKEIDSHPLLVIDDMPVLSTEAEADKEAVIVDKRIRKRFPYVTKAFTEKELQEAVSVDPEGKIMDEKFVHDWVGNKLPDYSDSEDYDLKPGDPDYEKIIEKLQKEGTVFNFSKVRQEYIRMLKAAHFDIIEIVQRLEKADKAIKGKSWGWVWSKRASRVSAYHETTTGGSGTNRHIFINPYKDDTSRLTTLIHEFMHFYTHDNFKNWVKNTTNSPFYVEGFTEFLTRQVMTAKELKGASGYQDRFEAVRDEVATHVSVEDIAMAYLKGEVWRIEGSSAVAKAMFKGQIGLDLDAPRGDEVEQSKAANGIIQTDIPGKHYRFMNLGVGQTDPKPEHRAAFESIYIQFVKGKPKKGIRFVGHTSTTGAKWLNTKLSKERSAAFYQMAKDLGVPSTQLIGASSPKGKSSDDLNADDSDVFGRAFNRRTELFIETTTT